MANRNSSCVMVVGMISIIVRLVCMTAIGMLTQSTFAIPPIMCQNRSLCPQMRVDLYDVNGHVYVGELTLTSSGGYMNHFTQAFLDKLGQFTVLPIDKK